MLHEFRLQAKHHAWERPIYKHNGRIIKKTHIASSTTAYKTRITDEFFLSVENGGIADRFPLIDKLAIHINVHSERRYILPFVIKNTLDALKGHAYNDDHLVCSVYAEQHNGGDNDNVCVKIYANKRITSGNAVITSKPLLTFNSIVVPSDVILPLRASPEHIIEPSASNQQTIEDIEKELSTIYTGQEYSSVKEVSIDMYSTLDKADIDNIAFPFFMAMSGIVYKDSSCIDRVILNINRRWANDYTDIRITADS